MIFKALENAHKAGFSNINIDLIYDTCLDNKKMLEFELSHLEQIKPLITHLSAYNLSLEPHTAFAKKEHFKWLTADCILGCWDWSLWVPL